MAWVNIAGGIGRGISRGGEDWRAWDEEKRKKEQFEFQQAENKRKKEQWAREDMYRAQTSATPTTEEAQVRTPFKADTFDDTDVVAGNFNATTVQKPKPVSRIAAERAEIANRAGLPEIAERQEDRARTAKREERTDAQNALIDAAMSAARMAGMGDLPSAIRQFESTFQMDPDLAGAKMVIEGNKFAVHHPKMPGKYLIPPTELNEANVNKAISTALKFASPEMYDKAITRGIAERNAAAAETTAGAAATRAQTDASLAPAQSRLYGAQAGYYDRMPQFAPRESAADKLPMQPILFTETGQHGWVKPTIDPKTGVASYILPKGAVAMKTPDKANKETDLGDRPKEGWTGLRRYDYESGGFEVWGFDKNGKYRLFENSPGRGEGNQGSKDNTPSKATLDARLNKGSTNGGTAGGDKSPPAKGEPRGIQRPGTAGSWLPDAVAGAQADDVLRRRAQEEEQRRLQERFSGSRPLPSHPTYR